MEEKYFKDGDNICRITVDDDMTPPNPRVDWDGHLGHMLCWYDGYRLGDKNDYRTPEDFLDEMLRKHYSEDAIVRLAKSGKLEPNIELMYNRKSRVWELYADYVNWYPKQGKTHGFISYDADAATLVDNIIVLMSISEKIRLLEKKGFFFLPLAVYDHSGITMYVGSRDDHFDGRWDCSNVGWIYTTKTEMLESGCQYRAGNGKYYPITAKNWKKAAETILTGEVEEYDMYLTGEVYGYTIEEYDYNDLDWVETDSCWGFFSKKYGDDLVKELAFEAGFGDVKLYDSVKDLRKAAA